MAKYAQGFYEVKNPQKYIGNGKPKYRSGWELRVMMFLDNNQHITRWASEAISIPYKNPLTGKQTIYIPDFFVMYVDANGQQHAEVIEVKPHKETGQAKTRSRRDALVAVKNQAKWAAAHAWCAANGMTFRVVTEFDMFRV